jgi:hypothetical protein
MYGGEKVISFIAAGSASFGHPWKTTVSGNTVSIRPGNIQGIQACINKIPLAGDDKNPPPKLTIQLPLAVDKNNCAWLCAQITYDPKKGNSITGVEMIVTNDLDNGASLPYAGGGCPDLPGNKANYPVTMFRQIPNSQTIEVYEIAFFNAQHGVELAKDGKTVSRHFFW